VIGKSKSRHTGAQAFVNKVRHFGHTVQDGVVAMDVEVGKWHTIKV
jgi:hypothetical protein